MPLQNRVDPYGRPNAVASRGTLMGNRGVLHDASKRIVASWRTRRWIACVLEFRGRHREVFGPRRYSELFFLDEATALSAGHRPCAECRHGRYEEFRAAWAAGQGRKGERPGADEMDRTLHGERNESAPGAPRLVARISSLPRGVMIELEGRPWLVLDGGLRPWRFEGYGPARRVSTNARARVLTPGSIVGAIRAGFLPAIHGSAIDARGRG
ncbi:MAG TPA: hypothetical protein VFA98_08145 [Thermoanaerobaculia bacterium]|nr:hypothetical protein [Thermoanaerobaculia bacterium]